MGNAESERQRAYSAFVSHASADAEKAMEIVEALEHKGLTSWVAPRDIVPGREYAEEIIRGIDRSKCFVLLVSEASNLSSHVRREVERAASKSKPIYPVRIEDVPPSPKLEYFISMHQWIDALDGVLAPHADRLAAAIASDEEWVGNLVLVRRRRWRIGSVLTAAAAAAVVIAGMAFAPDLRSLLQSEQQRAAAELSARGLAIGGDGIARAMAAANVPDLDLFLRAGVRPGQLSEAFSQAGETFFERSRGDPEAMRWLRDALASGVDPNMTVPNDNYGREGIFAAAVRSGNHGAVLALLEAGGSPHPYQDLHLSPYALPRFLFPYAHVFNQSAWTAAEQAQVAGAVAAAGAVVVPPGPDAEGFRYSHREQYTTVVEAAEEFEIPTAIMPSGCEARPLTTICETATRTTGTDWCALVAELPRRVVWNRSSYDPRLLGFDIHHLLTVVDGRGYVLATTLRANTGGYALLEIAADGRTWNLYRFMEPGAGLGHCRPLADQAEDFRPDHCWRRFSMRWEPERSIVRLEDYYDYAALEQCSRIFPNE